MNYSKHLRFVIEDFFGCLIVLISVGIVFAVVENYFNIEWDTLQFIIMCIIQSLVYSISKHVFDRVYRKDS